MWCEMGMRNEHFEFLGCEGAPVYCRVAIEIYTKRGFFFEFFVILVLLLPHISTPAYNSHSTISSNISIHLSIYLASRQVSKYFIYRIVPSEDDDEKKAKNERNEWAVTGTRWIPSWVEISLHSNLMCIMDMNQFGMGFGNYSRKK